MLRKYDQYIVALSKCVANSELATTDEVRELWSGLADSYRTLLDFENRHPTPAAADASY